MRNIILVAIASTWLFGCSSCKDKNKVHFPLNANVKPFVNFAPGSYWVYKELNSGREDSFAVTGRKYSTSENNDGALIDFLEVAGLIYPLTGDTSNSGFVFELGASSGAYILQHREYNFANSYRWDISIPSALEQDAKVTKYSNYSIQGNLFTTAYKISGYYAGDTMIITPQIGLVKAVLYHQSNDIRDYELLRWSVTQ